MNPQQLRSNESDWVYIIMHDMYNYNIQEHIRIQCRYWRHRTRLLLANAQTHIRCRAFNGHKLDLTGINSEFTATYKLPSANRFDIKHEKIVDNMKNSTLYHNMNWILNSVRLS